MDENTRHPFIVDAHQSPECAACGYHDHIEIHREPFDMTREQVEDLLEECDVEDCEDCKQATVG